ncbi:Rv3654c family TadE-like protein [Ruania albidiflava]|uniref:Rv3654c family TadE-like protein n=1 Tax=Ruania albidiflava TaxID=366586 RepID=UPI0003B5A937|nr:Rv3654c family TadE-like protein [Ruania albidiflava]
MRRQGWGGDRGSMTVVMLGVIAGALLLAVLVGGLVRGVTARGHAQAAADLAALAAGEVAAVGGPAPCQTADQVAQRNGAGLVSCETSDGGMVDLATEVAVQLLPGWQQSASATARAGPVGRS